MMAGKKKKKKEKKQKHIPYVTELLLFITSTNKITQIFDIN